MKLASFQILNCFGFRDSGEVNLLNSNNLIYILGRNSSGKSSLLNAINYFEFDKTPSEMRNFQNFNKSNANSILKAKFSFEKTKLSKDGFVQNVSSKLEKINIDEYVKDTNSKIKEFVDQSISIYSDLIDELNTKGKVEIQKLGDGSFHFVQDEFNKYKTRKAKIEELISNAKDQYLRQIRRKK